MKKNVGSLLALYPTPVTVIGAMNDEKPTWTLVAHIGIIGHNRVLVSLAAPHFVNGCIQRTKKLSKPVLFEFPTYQYLRTGEVIGKCLSFKRAL